MLTTDRGLTHLPLSTWSKCRTVVLHT